MNNEAEYSLIGLMSGSSLDGVDLAYCRCHLEPLRSYQIVAASTYPYPIHIKEELIQLNGNKNKEVHRSASAELARFFSVCIQQFIQENQLPAPDAIASHGHTILHQPQQGITVQLGNGKLMAELLHLPVIDQFRQADVDAGGQGAPLVPICDAYFFSEYDVCLNLGGIANISLVQNEKRTGYDIVPVNQLLNFLASRDGREFDDEGKWASAGKPIPWLLNQWNQIEFLDRPTPKSLDNFYVKQQWLQVLSDVKAPTFDLLHTAVEHIAIQISQHLTDSAQRILITGGGAYNSYLLERITAHSGKQFQLPGHDIIQYKEALAMCLMGILFLREEPNFIPAVTGATKAVCGGQIHYPERWLNT